MMYVRCINDIDLCILTYLLYFNIILDVHKHVLTTLIYVY